VRFRLAHKVATYLLASTAVFTLGTAGVVSALTLVLVVLLSAASWYADPETPLANGVARLGILLNGLTLVFLAGAAFQVARSFPDVDLLPFINFVLFLLALKLFQRRSNRDYLQIFILSFLVLLAAAWLATSVVFIVGFGIYVVLATWTLVLFHLRREIEENYIVRHASESRTEQVTATRVLNSRRVVGAAFFASTGAVALLVLLGSSLVFAMVPRVGLGFILGGVRRPVGIAGFTDEVKLGMHGVISTDNQTVVLRAQIPPIEAIASDQARERAIAALYWRGTVYDTYDKGQWLRSRDEQTRTRLGTLQSPSLSREYWVSPPLEEHPARGRKAALEGTVEHTVEIVALSHPVAFALDRPVLFDIPAPAPGAFTAVDLEPRWSDEVSLRMFRVNPANPFDRHQAMTEFLGARYRAFSRLADRAHPDRRSLAIEQLRPGALDNYLRVPASLSARLLGVSNEIMAGHATPVARVQAVVAWLRRTHGYTTNLKRNASIADPLEDFLFAEKDGHCEYFASAAAILLRMGGVPTRYVNGFLGGEWNDLRQAVTVRENRAHSWVEAYLGQEGWVRVDATPALARGSHMSAFRQVVDAAELFWGRWVVEYSASQQLLLAQKLGHKLGFSARGYGGGGQHRGALSRRQALIAAGLLVLAIALIGQRKRFGRWRWSDRAADIGQRPQAPIERVYHATLKRLAAAGQPRLPTETPHEYLERLRATKLEGAAVLAQLTELYSSSCYGDVDVPPDVVADLRRETHQIELGD
jgi:transglutaminase-like putative cysteine protease